MITKQAAEYIKLGSGGSYSLARDAIKHQIWDTRYFGSAISGFTFFSQPIGAPWRAGNKTLNETNLADSGKLPNGQTMLFTHFTLGLQTYLEAADVNAAPVAQAFTNLIHSSVFEIRIAGRDFDFQIHGSQFLPRPISVNSVTTATVNASTIGQNFGSGIVKLEPAPIFIDQLVSFNVVQRLENPDPTVDAILDTNSTLLNSIYATMNVILIGFLTRAK